MSTYTIHSNDYKGIFRSNKLFDITIDIATPVSYVSINCVIGGMFMNENVSRCSNIISS